QEETIIKMHEMISKKTEPGFTYEDFVFLSRNEHERYADNSRRIAHAVIQQDVNGHKIASQYHLPAGNADDTPTVCRIKNITEIKRNGVIRYQAEDADGNILYARRHEQIQIKVNEEESISAEINYFSEEEKGITEEARWGSTRKIARFLAPRSTPPKTKGGNEVTVDPVSVLARDKVKRTGLSQNSVMGTLGPRGGIKPVSAKDAYKAFFTQMKDKLSPEILQLLKRAFSKGINNWEWLHSYAHSLTALSEEPQHKDKLGAGPTWANTEMMILERIAKWFVLNPGASTKVKMKTIFDMLEESELINTIHFEITLEFEEKFIHFIQDIDAFQETPVLRKASDLAQAAGIGHAILHDALPICTEPVINLSAAPASSHSKVYKTVPETITPRSSTTENQYVLTIIDTETRGLNPLEHDIIEIGVLSVLCTEDGDILSILDSYNGLQDPEKPLDDEIIEKTGITDEQLKDQTIDWERVKNMLKASNCVVCHNSRFDRKFLESPVLLNMPKTPEAMASTCSEIQNILRDMPFGCTLQDINWGERGYSQRGLEYLNLCSDFEYKAHRALTDCFAVLNVLREVEGTLPELINNTKASTTLVCATDTPYSTQTRKQLKKKNFQWSDGKNTLPKGWFIEVPNEQAGEVVAWLNNHIYRYSNTENIQNPKICQVGGITAKNRYSTRSETLLPTYMPPLTDKKRKSTKAKLTQADKPQNKKAHTSSSSSARSDQLPKPSFFNKKRTPVKAARNQDNARANSSSSKLN
ncbi:MAG: hypothetical protein K0U37_07810, partial [Gammaproteobacteria bacterium]|nr:hypothetical protein [Gammaproteobacteria bacterium]